MKKLVILLATLSISLIAAESPKPLKVLLLTSGGYHDYKKLGPYLTNELAKLVPGQFDWKHDLSVLNDANFGKNYDAVIYDFCDDEAPDAAIENAIRTTREGKPTVMIHCAVHAFRKSPKLSEWENCCGLRSKVHDPYGVFTIRRLDPSSAITKDFPNEWTTPGDELYQEISIAPKSHPLLRAKSARDGREHVVAWTTQQEKGRIFATTLGHDMKTTSTPEFLRLVANGLKWAAHQLEPQK